MGCGATPTRRGSDPSMPRSCTRSSDKHSGSRTRARAFSDSAPRRRLLFEPPGAELMTIPTSAAASWPFERRLGFWARLVARLRRSALFRLLHYIPAHRRYAALTVCFGTLGFLLSFVYPW